MRIDIDVNAYLAWVPLPGGVKVTQGDLDSGLVMKMADGTYRARKTLPAMKNAAGENEHGHAQTLHESQIVNRLVVLAMCGKGIQGRVQTAIELIAPQLSEHLESQHMERLVVHDEGPDEALCRAEIVKQNAAHVAWLNENIAAGKLDWLREETEAGRQKPGTLDPATPRISAELAEKIVATYTRPGDVGAALAAMHGCAHVKPPKDPVPVVAAPVAKPSKEKL